MIPQQQNDIHLNEEETLPPHDQRQPSEPIFSWRSWSFWFRIIGVALAFAGVYVVGPLVTSVSSGMFIVPFILVVSAGLIRSWWSLLLVAVAFSIWFFSSPFGSFVDSGETNVLIVGAWLFTLTFLELSVVIVTFIGKWIEERLRH